MGTPLNRNGAIDCQIIEIRVQTMHARFPKDEQWSHCALDNITTSP